MRRLLVFWAVPVVVLTGLLWSSPVPAHAEGPLPGPASWPLAGAPEVSRPFEPPETPYGPGHRGVDLTARTGDQVLAIAGGTVAFAGQVAGRGVVTVDHGGGLRTTYEPVQPSVRAGDRVGVGDPLGSVGPGSHCPAGCLHVGLRQGDTYLDPLSLLAGAGAADGFGDVRLVSAAQQRQVIREVRTREAAAAARVLLARRLGPVGRPGSHGFSRPVPGAVTSAFGMRFHPVLHRTKLHDGTDFGAPCGTPIRAPYAGRVASVGYAGGYGNRLVLEHGTVDGRRVETAYNHASRYVAAVGSTVRRGDVLGYVGSTGYSTGCHLHLMLELDGQLVDPMRWF